MNVKRWLIILSLTVIAACGSGISVRHDFDQTVEFRRYRRYAWLAQPSAQNAQDGMRVNTILDRRIKQAVNVQLLSRGMQLVDNNPDLYITYHTGVENQINVDNYGYNYGGYWGGGGVSTYNYKKGTLVLDLIDVRTKELVWRGSASKTLEEDPTPEKMSKTINEAVEKLLKEYPPKSSY